VNSAVIIHDFIHVDGQVFILTKFHSNVEELLRLNLNLDKPNKIMNLVCNKDVANVATIVLLGY